MDGPYFIFHSLISLVAAAMCAFVRFFGVYREEAGLLWIRLESSRVGNAVEIAGNAMVVTL